MIKNIKAMAVFSVVVEEGSFRKAATKLSLSPSVISDYVGQLEVHVGAPLLYRSTRKMSLTDYGKRFYPSCQHMVYWAEAGLHDLIIGEGVISGKLNLTLPSVLIHSSVPKIIADFCEAYPQIEVTLNFDNQKHNIVEEGIDLAIRVGILEDSNLKAMKIMDIKRVICGSKSYLSNHKKIDSPKDLTDHTWVKTELLGTSTELHNIKLNKTEKFNVDKGIVVKGGNASRELMLADYGLALGPKFLVKNEIANGELIEVLPDWHAQSPSMYFVWIDNKIKNPIISYFTEFAIQRLRDALATD